MNAPHSSNGRPPLPWERPIYTRTPSIVEKWSRAVFWWVGLLLLGATAALGWLWLPLGVVVGAAALLYLLVGVRDMLQTSHTLLRNFPVIAHFRYAAESIRPELRQYFVESNHEENPFSREKRSIVYQRAKQTLDSVPFGTQRDVYRVGYTWLGQSLAPTHPDPSSARVMLGEGRCSQPYSASIFNISAMSFGSLSKNAILALNKGAAEGGFFHNTGEGGVSPYHLEPGGDLCWQIGTGYFGCRSPDGGFDEEKFKENAAKDAVKLIEVKLSQGAKPGHGGILPGRKVTPEIAAIRGVPVGETVESPPVHSAFDGPKGLLEFVTRLRDLSGGKPVGFKLCVGLRHEVMAICKAMVETGLRPDFITVDGAEGGTGAAPIEFTNSVGMPLSDGLHFLHNALRGAGVRDDVKIIAAGKITTGFHLLMWLALGADLCNSARGMMFALGCIQALKCNSNKCPVGVATQNPRLMRGLVVDDKATRVASYHERTVESLLDLVGAAGLDSPADLEPGHLYRRLSSTQVDDLAYTYDWVPRGCLLAGKAPETYQSEWDLAQSDSFHEARPAA
jgi:glutamate synthase domain-containing protein 2